jgi:transcriptional regulator
MYVPRATRVEDDALIRTFVAECGAATLVTVGPDGNPDATLLPVLWESDLVVGHLARANDHWNRIDDGAPGLFMVTGPQAYVSPSWYASKAEHGRVVPTWNYVTAHVYGELVVHDDPVWVEALVRRLTGKHEASLPHPWSVDDAPPAFVAGQLRAIVGVELRITRIEAKAKLSQNRPEADVEGVVAGLDSRGDHAGAEAVRAANTHG